MRLIDADALIALYGGDNDLRVSVGVVKQNIADMPTIEAEQTILELSNLLAEKDKIIKELSQIRTDIEAEPIVRCKDCKRNHAEECSMWYESDDHQEQYSWNNPDDYCSRGERKESEE